MRFTDEDLLEAGYTKNDIEAVFADGLQFASIDVYEPCACGPCAAGRRWFYCDRLTQRYVMSYFVVTDGPIAREVRDEIAALHPDKDLIGFFALTDAELAREFGGAA